MDALTTLTSKIHVPGEAIDASIIGKTLQATTSDLVPDIVIDEQDWSIFIHNLARPSSTMVARDLKGFYSHQSRALPLSGGSFMARALSTVEAKQELQRAHNLLYGDNDIKPLQVFAKAMILLA